MSPKKKFVSKLRSSLSFRQITNYCKIYMCKTCAVLSHLQMCQCLVILLAISFLDYPQIESWYDVEDNSATVCIEQLIWRRHCLVRFWNFRKSKFLSVTLSYIFRWYSNYSDRFRFRYSFANDALFPVVIFILHNLLTEVTTR